MMPPGTGTAMTPDWFYRAPPAGRHTDGTVLAKSTHDEMGPNAGHGTVLPGARAAPDRSPTARLSRPAACSRREQHTANGGKAVMVMRAAAASSKLR